MKTIKDACEALNGDLSNITINNNRGCGVLWFNADDNCYFTQMTSGARYDSSKYRYICTVEEFNAYVDLLASNMGNGNMHELSNYRDEISLGNVPVASKENQSTKKEYASMEIDCTTPEFNNYKPDELVYTQKMADNGEPPIAGMQCLIHHKAYSISIESIVTVVATTTEYLIVKHDGCKSEQHYHLKSITFKPLPTTIALEDGKAYQFDYFAGNAYQGTYDCNGDCFWVKSNPVTLKHASNIKPLTVEVKQ